jgi:hypothetical protein
MNVIPSNLELVMNQVNLPTNTTGEALAVSVQGMDVIIGLLAVISITLIFILIYTVKRRRIV